ncbi:MAG: nitrite/sulfite reductase [Rhodospirillaceae bacterium]|nr:nitrite/sulfite reductase [Rhodospirillaceae bacterium]
MYRYDEFDHALVQDRVAQYRDQVERRLSGELTEEQFRPLRLMNGLYLQLHAYMLRVAIPYGTLSSRQLRKLAHISRKYDRGYGHWTTRQNIQFNWPKLDETPDILAELAEVEMHDIQTSGNTIRNVTGDAYGGVAADEVEDPRIWAEIIRQWSTLHPEFSFLPRKFKIAVTGAPHDRAAVRFHDIGIIAKRNWDGEIGFEILIGGGLGRTPMIAKTVRQFLPKRHLLSYIEAILRVYNLLGRRDNKYKARIKIMVHELGIDEVGEMVEDEWERIKTSELELPAEEIARIEKYFQAPAYEPMVVEDTGFAAKRFEDKAFAQWVRSNVAPHKQPGYAIVNLSVKPEGQPPGDVTDAQMDAIADLAETYSMDELRVTHEQNLVFPYVKQAELYELWQKLAEQDLATANVGLAGDIIACPGLDYCSLASARSIPVAQRISKRFADLDLQHDIGELRIKISGCINACGHHHVGHIGLLGVDRRGEEYYQITLGGAPGEDASVGSIIGPALSSDDIVDAVEELVHVFIEWRREGERFLDTYRRVGAGPFKTRLYEERFNAAA